MPTWQTSTNEMRADGVEGMAPGPRRVPASRAFARRVELRAAVRKPSIYAQVAAERGMAVAFPPPSPSSSPSFFAPVEECAEQQMGGEGVKEMGEAAIAAQPDRELGSAFRRTSGGTAAQF